jgi:hypothetical protein
MMKRLLVAALVLALVGIGVPVPVGAAGQQKGGSVSGAVHNSARQPVANTTVRLRNADTGELVETTITNAKGGFTFTGVPQGNYVIEVVNAAGDVIGTSSTVAVTAGMNTVSGVAITLAARGAAGAAAAAGGAGGFFTSTAGILVIAAAGAGLGVGIYEGTKSRNK